MQVAVTAAHPARLPALIEQPAKGRQFAAQTVLETIELRRSEARRTAIAQNTQIGLSHLSHRRHAAPVQALLGLPVKPGDMGSKRIAERR